MRGGESVRGGGSEGWRERGVVGVRGGESVRDGGSEWWTVYMAKFAYV